MRDAVRGVRVAGGGGADGVGPRDVRGLGALPALRLRDASGLATLPQFHPDALDAIEIGGESLGELATRLRARDGMIVVPQTHGLV